MLRTLLNQQLGLHNSDDRTIKINFYTRKYLEAYAKLNVNDADYISNLLICEGSLKELHELGIDIMLMARNLFEEYTKVLMDQTRRKIIPHFQKKMLHHSFHYFKAIEIPAHAINVLGIQESFNHCYFTEEQMLELDNVIARNSYINNYLYTMRLNSFNFVAKYYLRAARRNPNILENYAAYLCQISSIPFNENIASKLNRFMMHTLDPHNDHFPSNLFPGWQVCVRNDSLYINTDDICIPLQKFITTLRRNETVFAYCDYRRQLKDRVANPAIAEQLFDQLAICIERLINTKSILSTLTYDVLKIIAQYEQNRLSSRAQHALSECKREQEKPIDLPRYSTIKPTR